MKFSLAWAAIAAGTLQILFTAAPLFAQAPAGRAPITPVAARPAGTNVAVIDISLVFEHYPKFQAQMKDLKGEVEQFEQTLRADQQNMTKERDNLQAYAAGSPQYKEKEEELAKLGSGIQVKMALQRKTFLEKEARIYFDAYNEVYEKVAVLADRNDIKLVLRFNSDEMKPEDRASVLQGVNRAVVFQRNLNITKLVIQELGGNPNANTTPAGAGGTAGKVAPKSTLNR